MRVDCAESLRICSDLGVHSYPTLFLGRSEHYVNKQVKELQEFPRTLSRTAPSVVQWLAGQLNLTLTYQDATEDQIRAVLHKDGKPAAAGDNAAAAAAASALDHKAGTAFNASWIQSIGWQLQDVEEATLQLFGIIERTEAMHSGADKRQALKVLRPGGGVKQICFHGLELCLAIGC